MEEMSGLTAVYMFVFPFTTANWLKSRDRATLGRLEGPRHLAVEHQLHLQCGDREKEILFILLTLIESLDKKLLRMTSVIQSNWKHFQFNWISNVRSNRIADPFSPYCSYRTTHVWFHCKLSSVSRFLVKGQLTCKILSRRTQLHRLELNCPGQWQRTPSLECEHLYQIDNYKRLCDKWN